MVRIPLTFGAGGVQLRSESKWHSSDIGRYSQRDVSQGRSGQFLGLSVVKAIHLHFGDEEENW